mmetsp:Transcript_83489/g.194122  ORF Transcript_83489/g.194122 Transcript_83489/m.194122 type:complete len:318 (+) Transcript_83489:92-1045(+)
MQRGVAEEDREEMDDAKGVDGLAVKRAKEFAHPWLDAENNEQAAGASTETAAEVKIPTLPPPSSIVPTKSPDVRIVALRNLLSNLLQDASGESERAHFSQLLELLEAGPCGSGATARSVFDCVGRTPAAITAAGSASSSGTAASTAASPAASLAGAPGHGLPEGSPRTPSAAPEVGANAARTTAASALRVASLSAGSTSAPSATAAGAAIASASSTATGAQVATALPLAAVPLACEARSEGTAAVPPLLGPALGPARTTTPSVLDLMDAKLPGSAEPSSDVQTLRGMGFCNDDVAAALRSCASLDLAVEWLLAKSLS